MKIQHAFILLVSSIILIFTSCKQDDTAGESSHVKLDKLSANFQSPGNKYRGKPFWAWNGELKENELLRQIEIFEDMGFGGFFMHSRTGLQTEYLSDKWFNLINACTEKAKTHNMEAWLYDEDRWPSGLAGGLVTKNPEYRMKYVSLYTPDIKNFHWSDSIIAVFSCKRDSLSISNIQRYKRNESVSVKDDETLLVFVEEKMANWSFFNGYTYLNTLKREATKKFIDITHNQYKKECGDEFGKAIKGIFTDEPHRGCVFGGFGMVNENKYRMTPWTDKLPQRFEEEFGYNIIDYLPELFFKQNGNPVAQVKWHYM